jgi:glycosyltransferase involved in cell wall biosynthesis
VNRFIALTPFAANKLVLGGLPAKRIEIKPNFLPSTPEVGKGRGGFAVYVGRLSEEKGVRTLIQAWREISNLPLKILGDGPLRLELEHTVIQHGLPVEFLGYCSTEEIFNTVGEAVLQVIPSEWYEPFGMVALEGYASGTPIVASKIGSLEEIVISGETGFLFQAGNAHDLAKTIKMLLNDKHALKSMRINARNYFLANYTGKKNFQILMRVYKDAMIDFKDRQAKPYINSTTMD